LKGYCFLQEADIEFQEHIRYFEEQVAGLGDKFMADLEAVISSVREYPESGVAVSRNLRKRTLRVFRHKRLLRQRSQRDHHRSDRSSSASS
jgi:hypothetical protein